MIRTGAKAPVQSFLGDFMEDMQEAVQDFDDSDNVLAILEEKPKPMKKKAEVKPVVADTSDPVSQIMLDDVVVFMKTGQSYFGPGIEFTKDSPFQRMNAGDAQRLIDSIPSRFCLATKDQIREFYSLG